MVSKTFAMSRYTMPTISPLSYRVSKIQEKGLSRVTTSRTRLERVKQVILFLSR